MTIEIDKQLEDALGELSVWRRPTPNLWRRALAATKPKTSLRPKMAGLLRHRATGLAAACIAIAALGTTIAFNLPNLQRLTPATVVRQPAASAEFGEYAREDFALQAEKGVYANDGTAWFGQHVRGSELQALGYVGYAAEQGDESVDLAQGGFGYFAGAATEGRGVAVRTDMPRSGGARAADSAQAAPAEPRHIVRKATVELLTKDVRAAFLKAAMIINEAGGEYVQESSITGSGKQTQANLTLRVTADRLSAVLNALRELGKVHSEQVTGEDVSTQVVDLEARLRNEQRVEAELLELMEQRNDAPLKEILELRTTLGQVRGNIERMVAERQRLGRLVSLATVLVIIRSDGSPLKPQTSSIGAYFVDSLKKAWRKGLVLLSDTFASIISIIVGGLIWWILLILAIAMIRRYWRRSDSTTRS